MNDQILFRCYDLRGKEFLFYDVSITDPSFPEYLGMIQIGGWENYELHRCTGVHCSTTGEYIYEKDIVKHKSAIYYITFNPPAFVLECLNGDALDFVGTDTIEKLSSVYDATEELTQIVRDRLLIDP